METINFKENHLGTLPDLAIRLKNQIEFYKEYISPDFDDMEDWEINEYKQVHKQNIEQLTQYIKEMIDNETIFNALLSCYNISTTVFCRKYLIESTRWDLIKECEGTQTEIDCIEYAKQLSPEHPIFKVGDIIDFWAGYYNDIRMQTKIIGFGKSTSEQTDNDQIFLLWDCYWFPIRNESNRNIVKVN